jgi:voltage-gated potassium channel Kch
MSATSGKPSEIVGPLGAAQARVIITGFGLPGRSLAEVLETAHIAYSVVETNPDVVTRCQRSGKPIVCGDAREETVLREAGIGAAEWLAVMMPMEGIVLEVIRAARAINPQIKILARTSFTSTGMEAVRLGAEEVIVAEQVVADEAARILKRSLQI